MASRTVECRGPEGLVAPVTLQLAVPGTDALTTTIAMTEGTTFKARYTGTLVDIATGKYDCNLISESNIIMVGELPHVDEVSAVVEKVGDVVAELVGITSLADWIRMLARSDAADATAKLELNSGGGTYGEGDDSLQAIQADIATLAAIGAGGAFTVTVTVTNVTTGLAVQGATVKIKDGVTVVDTSTTNVSGVATPTANAGTYTLVVSYPGVYASSSQALVVDGDETVAVAITALSITAPAAPNLTTGYVVCYGTDGLIEVGVLIYAKMVEGVGTDAYSHDTAQITMTSDAAGLAQHTGFVRGAKYVFSRGTAGRWTDPEVAPNATTWALPEILGYS